MCVFILPMQMYGRYTELSKFAKQFATTQRERSSSGSRQSRTVGIEEAKRRKSKTWSECKGCLTDWHISYCCHVNPVFIFLLHQKVPYSSLSLSLSLSLSSSPPLRSMELGVHAGPPLHHRLDVHPHPWPSHGTLQLCH